MEEKDWKKTVRRRPEEEDCKIKTGGRRQQGMKFPKVSERLEEEDSKKRLEEETCKKMNKGRKLQEKAREECCKEKTGRRRL